MTAPKRINRTLMQLRPIVIVEQAFGYSKGSVLVSVGNTKILCAITIQAGVPSFLKGKQEGWLTAEYAMLPTATHVRLQRPSAGTPQNGRSVELSRLIGRVLRTIIDPKSLGDKTIIVDCDVLQADGGTRTAAISGAVVALMMIQKSLVASKVMQPFLIDYLAAVSVAIIDGHIVVDPTYEEDSRADADFNFVFTRQGNIVEVQGGSEKCSVSKDLFHSAFDAAYTAVQDWFLVLDPYWQQLSMMNNNNAKIITSNNVDTVCSKKGGKVPFFSLYGRSRINNTSL